MDTEDGQIFIRVRPSSRATATEALTPTELGLLCADT